MPQIFDNLFQTIQCPDCPLKFPLKAALKYHQEMAHQVCFMCYKNCIFICDEMLNNLSDYSRLFLSIFRPMPKYAQCVVKL